MPPPCPLCGSDAATLLSEVEDYEYGSLPDVHFEMWQCDACGHGRLDPLPAPDQLGDIYPSTYYTVNPASPIRFPDSIYEVKMRRDVGRIVSLVEGRRVRSAVDLGCGDAERLARLGEALGGGVDLVGVDFQPDPDRVTELAKRGVRLLQADIEGGLDVLEDGAHDLFILCQIIEHLRDPVGVLRSLSRKLAPGGRVLIETPNIGGVDFRLFRQRYWGAYHTPRHFHLFTRSTLERATREAGLTVARSGFIPSGFFIVSLRNRLGLTSVERSPRFGEFLCMKNLLVVGLFSAFDLLWIALGGQTSNQYLLAEKPLEG